MYHYTSTALTYLIWHIVEKHLIWILFFGKIHLDGLW